jgi:hypothetical protein
MPHRCTNCGKEYADGDMQILKGCECGNNKFLYVPKDRRDVKEKAEETKSKISELGVESVRIISPGQYEINLDKILSRDEIVIALQEDGKYVLHLPSLLKVKKGSKKKE